tara:strand:- start:510 stop:1106 length:597 start_codon:yes stop_codon:yes gene_type:complete
MIQFEDLIQETPYLIFKENYDKALKANQKNIEAISISSYSNEKKEVNSRYVNLKFVNKSKFIFFSNYNSPKSKEFENHNQITALIYWNKTNIQIRMKAIIKKTSKDFNQLYFSQRDKKKNALAICSKQSNPIDSYETFQNKFDFSLKNNDLNICPDYWGGFSFTPFYFEFWEGHESRLNKREVYELRDDKWIHSFLQA